MQLELFEQPHIALLARIDAAIARMSAFPRTDIGDAGIANLKMKREWVVNGTYTTRQVNEELIAGIGREIGRLTRSTGLRSAAINRSRKHATKK